MKTILVFDQQIGYFPLRDLHTHVLEELPDLRLARPHPKIHRHDQGLDPRTILPFVPFRQFRQIGFLRRSRIVFLLVKTHVVRVYDQILHHHIFTALRLRIRWQFRPIHIQHFFPVNMDLCLLAALHMPFTFVPLLLRRMIAGWRLGLVPLDLRFSLFPFQTVDLIPIALRLCSRIPQIPTQLLHHVQQPLDQLSSVLLMDRIQVKVFEHGGVSLLAYLQTGKRSFFPTISPTY